MSARYLKNEASIKLELALNMLNLSFIICSIKGPRLRPGFLKWGAQVHRKALLMTILSESPFTTKRIARPRVLM